VTAYDPEPWSDLFVACAGAAAALAGLVFVAVSINIEQILKSPGLPTRALATLLLLMVAVVVSLVGLAPGQSSTALGIEFAALGALSAAGIGVLTARSATDEGPRGGHVFRLALSAAGTVPIAVAGISLLAESGGGLYWALGGLVGAVFGGVATAWVLLVEIRR
jgi:modulator of FtsH protease